ncbi:MAG: 1-acyl-sn-glycerol-3-phosphate acyltransferase [Lachnospiraceae bacterium]|nr:1-acyl-sn-glycerol-3-phosphate acyltransferase [Lachnospiraceae bacterium]
MLRFLLVIFLNFWHGPYMILGMRVRTKNRKKYNDEDRYAFAQKAIGYMKDSGWIKTKAYGEENLPKEGGYVMYPNHQGKYDALGIIYTHKKPCSFVMDKNKSYGFLVKEIVDMLGAKRMDVNNVRQGLKIINEMTAEVKEGKRYILFSEGGYNSNKNHVQEFKPGSFKCAMRANAPIVPVALIDSYKPFNSLVVGPITTKVIYLPPLYPKDYEGMKTPEVAKIVKERIVEAMKEYGVKE